MRPGFRRLLFIGGEEIIPRCKLPSEHIRGRVVFLVKTEEKMNFAFRFTTSNSSSGICFKKSVIFQNEYCGGGREPPRGDTRSLVASPYFLSKRKIYTQAYGGEAPSLPYSRFAAPSFRFHFFAKKKRHQIDHFLKGKPPDAFLKKRPEIDHFLSA